MDDRDYRPEYAAFYAIITVFVELLALGFLLVRFLLR